MRFTKLSILIALFISFSSPLHAGEIRIAENLKGYLAFPEMGTKKTVPGIILIHEWWGLNDNIKELAEKFSDQGYAALAVDLYEGTVAVDPSQAHELMRGLPDDRAVLDLKTAVTYLKNLKTIDANKIGVIGWCMGGGYALELGVRDKRIKAVVMYYGKIITDDERLKPMNAPLLGIFGALDRGITAASVTDFKVRMEQLGKRVDIHIYPEAGHAFANPANKDYRKDDAEDAWKKTITFFKANLA